MFQTIIWLDLVPVAMRLTTPLSQCWSVLHVACTPRCPEILSWAIFLTDELWLQVSIGQKRHTTQSWLFFNLKLLPAFMDVSKESDFLVADLHEHGRCYCYTLSHCWASLHMMPNRHQPAYWKCVFPSNHMMAVVHWVLNNSALLQRYPDCPPEGLTQQTLHLVSIGSAWVTEMTEYKRRCWALRLH